jgi:N-acetylornithine carbamoyltransferase
MQTKLRGRDLIGDLDFSKEEVETVLDVAFDLKRKRALGEPHAYLRDKVLAMLFFFSSTRTRGSFEAGIDQLGGHAAFIESKTTQISHGDTPVEIGEIFGRYLADLMTIMEKKGRDLRKRKIVVSWAYAASYQKPISVPQSLILQMPRFGMDVVLAHPPEFKLMPEIMDAAKEQAKKFHTGFDVISDPDGMERAFKDADVVYAKSWGAMMTTEDVNEGSKIIDKYKHWITDSKKLRAARDDAIYMHPLPADREVEVTSEVMDGPHSVVFDEAENRLHAQKAVMALTMS